MIEEGGQKLHDQRKKSKLSAKTNNVEKYRVLLVVSVIGGGHVSQLHILLMLSFSPHPPSLDCKS